MLKLIYRLLRKKPIAQSIDISKVQFGFECGGVTYYRFKDHPSVDGGNMPSRRYQEFATAHEAMRMGVNREFLEDYVRKMEDVFIPDATGKNQSINLNKIQRLNFELKTRMEIAPIGDDLFTFMSVVYFPLHEDVSRYDPQFNKAKIKAWKEAESDHDFFSKSLRNLPVAYTMGWSDTSPDAIQTFLQTQENILQTLQNLSSTN